MSVTLDSGKLWSRELIDEELDHLAGRFEGQATVDVRKGLSIISLICDASRSSQILKQVGLSPGNRQPIFSFALLSSQHSSEVHLRALLR